MFNTTAFAYVIVLVALASAGYGLLLVTLHHRWWPVKLVAGAAATVCVATIAGLVL